MIVLRPARRIPLLYGGGGSKKPLSEEALTTALLFYFKLSFSTHNLPQNSAIFATDKNIGQTKITYPAYAP